MYRLQLRRRCSTAYLFRDNNVFTLTPVSSAISLKLLPSISFAINTRCCSSGNSASASSSSSANMLCTAPPPVLRLLTAETLPIPATRLPRSRHLLDPPASCGRFLRNKSVIRLRATRNSHRPPARSSPSTGKPEPVRRRRLHTSSASSRSATRRRMKFRRRTVPSGPRLISGDPVRSPCSR